MSNTKLKPKIGIVSGFGPIAGIDVASKIHKYAAEQYGAIEDFEYPDFVLVSKGVEGFDKYGAINDKFEPAIINIVDELNSFEVTVMGIACNTAHLFYENIDKHADAQVINLIDEVVTESSKSTKPFLLLGSSTTRKTAMYIKALDKIGVEYLNPNDNVQTLIDHAIYLVMSHKLIEAGKKIDQIIAAAKPKRFQQIVLACTELPVAIKYSKSAGNYSIVDSNEILAKSLVDEYYKLLHYEE